MPNIIKKDSYNDLASLKKYEDLTVMLNQAPPADWIKVHPFITGYKYLPIERVEFLLKSLTKGQYKIEVLKTGLLLNTVEVTVRVHYKDPISGDWMFHDGVGASEIQTKKDSGHLQLDMSNINRGAITMALPNAKSVAVKDACDHIGDLFGASLNRKDLISYQSDITMMDLDEKHPNWAKVVDAVKAKSFTVEAIKEKYPYMSKGIEELLNNYYNGNQ